MSMGNIHPSSDISKVSKIGKNSRIWNQCQVRRGAVIGENCILGKNVYVDENVEIGDKVKIQNNCSIYQGSKIEDGVFIGPNTCLTNDKEPRAINTDGTLKEQSDWKVGKILVKIGASIGASSVILPGVTIGQFAMIGAGSVVTKDVPEYAVVYGNPADIRGYVCKCGAKITKIEEKDDKLVLYCNDCKEKITTNKK